MRFGALLLLVSLTSCATAPVQYRAPAVAPGAASGPMTAERINAICPSCRPPSTEGSGVSSAGTAAAKGPYPEVKRSPAILAKYQRAVADSLRDPESARFTGTRVVRTPEGKDALCGMVNAKNGFGGYTGNDLFFAEMIPVGDKFVSVPFLVRQVGVEYYAERCR